MSGFIKVPSTTSATTSESDVSQSDITNLGDAVVIVRKDLDGYQTQINNENTKELSHYNALSGAIQIVRKDLDGYTKSTGSTGDGYVAFFTGTNLIAGDNDLIWNRTKNKLTATKFEAGNEDYGITMYFDTTDGYIATSNGSVCLKPAVSDGYVDVQGDLRIYGQAYTCLVKDYTPAGTTQTIDWDFGNCQVLNLHLASGNVAVDFRNGQPGGSYLLKIFQGANSRAVTFPSECKWAGGSVPTITATANGVDVLSLWYDGFRYYCNIGQAYA